jgi:hypothetical protein
VSVLQWVPFEGCPEPRCERETGHDDPYGHWYTVWDEEGPSYPVQWGHSRAVCGEQGWEVA